MRNAIHTQATTVSWHAPQQPEDPKLVRVALVGLPNAGKSSLLNALLSSTIAAVSPKVNTTREDIKGILCADNCQIILMDCPGILESHRRRRFCAPLVDTAWRTYREADACLLVLDTVKRPDAELFRIVRLLAGAAPCDTGAVSEAGDGHVGDMDHRPSYPEAAGADDADPDGTELFDEDEPAALAGGEIAAGGHEPCERRKPVALVLNKIDLVQHKKWVKARTREMKNHGTFDDIFYTSAKHGIGVERVLHFLKAVARPGRWVYPPDMLTTMSKVQVVEQLVRTYIYCWFNKELPYQVGQKVIGWTPADNGSLIIEMELYVRNDKAAKIICGIQGRIVKQMQKNVSHRLSKMWQQPVFLYAQVKVKPAFLN
ncbi:small GTP-binding protein domain containing protein, putative [Babesia bigemina]|uniref:Small GTP-binding protein domain containing protein, putative n=1 Tax=Babesia bigemina TaxID=5866 RepID=A0A061DDE8_BABBI|nr:small GTP-binding protein domain containing protein, putative [Babesia bigemina]CDR97329.1 small GTP-binding protein domain containing protein, putative [Babesia bigemina]|eukprot:XP_012769515.1 small GTP-binding protein domain containing protein, putative [Babesia bigemina]